MKIIQTILILCITVSGCTSQPSEENDYSPQDSVFIFNRFIHYDNQAGKFIDVDEPVVYDYWNDNLERAVHYYQVATRIKSIPPSFRMVFASYLLEQKIDKPIKDILAGLKTAKDTTDVFYIMDSYGISFKQFSIKPEEVEKYCPDLEYN